MGRISHRLTDKGLIAYLALPNERIKNTGFNTEDNFTIFLKDFDVKSSQVWDVNNMPEDISIPLLSASSILSEKPGLQLIIAPGHYQLSAATLENISDSTISAYGATFHITLDNPGPLIHGGIRLYGNINRFTWIGGTFIGDGLISSSMAGIWANGNGTQITNCHFHDIEIRDTVLGISFTMNGDNGVSYIKQSTINNCLIENIVGPESGEGYGIVLENSPLVNDTQNFITNNVVRNCQRHALYIARGKGYHIENNRFLQHLSGYADPEGERAAITIARTENVVLKNNFFDSNYNGDLFLGVGEFSGEDTRNIDIDGVYITNPQGNYNRIIVGGTSGGENTNVELRNVKIRNVSCFSDSWNSTGSYCRFNYGHDISLENFYMERNGASDTTHKLLTFNGNNNTGSIAPETFSSNWSVQNGIMILSGTSGNAIRFNNNICTSSIELSLKEIDLRITGSVNRFSHETLQTNRKLHFVPKESFVSAQDFTLSSGWGTEGSISITPGSTNLKGIITVTASGTVSANPTIDFSRKEYMPNSQPYASAQITESSQILLNPISSSNTNNSTTRFTYVGTLTTGNSVSIAYNIGSLSNNAQQALYAKNSSDIWQRLVRLLNDTNVEVGSPGVATTIVNAATALQANIASALIMQITTNGLFMQSGKTIGVGSFSNATRPVAGVAGRIGWNTDDGNLNIDTGSGWILPDGSST